MFTHQELFHLREAVELKIGSLKRGQNSSKSPAFKEVFQKELDAYMVLLAKVNEESANAPKETVKGKV